MTSATIAAIEQQINEARARGDGRKVADLRAQLPFEERQRIFGSWITAAGRGYRLPSPQLVGGYDPLTGDYKAPQRSATPVSTGWPTVSITDSVRAILDDDVFDGRESGGYLFGPTEQPEGEILITRAVFAALDDPTYTSVNLDLDKAFRVWEELPAGLTARGDFHCHPNDFHVNPSSADLKSWERNAQIFDRPWVGLVVRTAPAWGIGLNGSPRATTKFELSATVARYENGRASHRNIEIHERSF
jgi:hypothetical protein